MEVSVSLWNIVVILGIVGVCSTPLFIIMMLKYRKDAQEWAKSQRLIASDIQTRLNDITDNGAMTDRGGDEAGLLVRYVQAYVWIDVLARYFKQTQTPSPLNTYIDKMNTITQRLALWQRVSRRVKELQGELSKRGATTEHEKGQLVQLDWMLREIRHGEV